MQLTDRARVIVADDHPCLLDAMVSLLSQTCEVVAAVRDGGAAVDATLRARPDVVVLDVAMPGFDGLRATKRIRESVPDARIVLVSHHTGDDVAAAGLALGASAFVSKMRLATDLAPAVAHAREGRAFVPSARVLPRWHRSADSRHAVQLFQAHAFLADGVAAYFAAALDAGQSIVAVASDPHLESIDSRLASRGLEVAALVDDGRYTQLNDEAALESIWRNGAPDAEAFTDTFDLVIARAASAATAFPAHVSMFGEVASILCARGEFDAMSCVERMGGAFSASRPVSILCAYSTDCLDGAGCSVAACVCRHHATIIPADA